MVEGPRGPEEAKFDRLFRVHTARNQPEVTNEITSERAEPNDASGTTRRSAVRRILYCTENLAVFSLVPAAGVMLSGGPFLPAHSYRANSALKRA